MPPPTQCAVKPSTVPLSSRLRTRRTEGRYRFMYPTEVIVPVFRQAISAGRHCAADSPIGFSRKSGTPAWAASSSTGPRANGGGADESGIQLAPADVRHVSHDLAARMVARESRRPHDVDVARHADAMAEWDVLRACCSPIRPHPKIATRSASGGWSMDIFGLYGATDLAQLATWAPPDRAPGPPRSAPGRATRLPRATLVHERPIGRAKALSAQVARWRRLPRQSAKPAPEPPRRGRPRGCS